MRGAALALLAFLLLSGAGAGLLGSPGLTLGPDDVVVLEGGWDVSVVARNFSYPSALAMHGDELLVLEVGRFPYDDPFAGQLLGKVEALRLAADGSVASQRLLAKDLADPLGMTVAPDGTVWLAQYGTVSRIAPSGYASSPAPVENVSWGYPTQSNDAFFLPVTGTDLASQLGLAGIDATDGRTTGDMGLAVRDDGQLLVAQGAHGVAPDDDGVRDVSHLGYDNPYSSSLIAPRGGPLTPDQVVARACRNCYDMAFAPGSTPWPGQLFMTENVGPYRLRAFAGTDRSLLAGGTPTDQGFLDGVDAVDFATGHMVRVADFRPDGAILGITPTGIAFSPHDFPDGHADQMFVVMFSGTPPSDNRGEVDLVWPDFVTGAGVTLPLVHGLDYPIDIAFAPDHRSFYVAEFYSGDIYRFTPP